jgi:hypothetical protein
LLPIGGDEFRLLGNGVNVVGECQGHDIRFQAIHPRLGLLGGATMRLLNGDHLAVFFLPVLGEGGVEVLIQLACRIIGNIQEREVFLRLRRCAKTQEQGQGDHVNQHVYGHETFFPSLGV